ncbi:MAG: hypothetical protein ACT4OO_06375 [Nitrospiraceae bacterium]
MFDLGCLARYSHRMTRRFTICFVLLVLVGVFASGLAASQTPSFDKPEPVSPEEYPIYDLIVATKFLTSETQLVMIERMTATRLHPDQEKPFTRATFVAKQFFDGRLAPDVVVDFVLKNHRASRLDARFNFGVRYRFVTGEGVEEPEVSLAVPAHDSRSTLAQDGPPLMIRLGFSRVAFASRRDQALVYVENPRPDGTGAGFLFWLTRPGKDWQILDTDVLWIARPAGSEPAER